MTTLFPAETTQGTTSSRFITCPGQRPHGRVHRAPYRHAGRRTMITPARRDASCAGGATTRLQIRAFRPRRWPGAAMAPAERHILMPPIEAGHAAIVVALYYIHFPAYSVDIMRHFSSVNATRRARFRALREPFFCPAPKSIAIFAKMIDAA